MPPSQAQGVTSSRVVVKDSMLSSAFLRDELIIKYGKALREARWVARIVGVLHSLSTFLAFCSLTWATVILLGAFASNLAFADFCFVTILLLLEAVRLASATFISGILTRSPDPGHPARESADLTARGPARFIAHVLQAFLIAPTLFCASVRLADIHFYASDLVNNLQISLRIFYVLVIVNVVVNFLTLLTSFAAWIRFSKGPSSEPSVLRYYDELLQNVLVRGVLQADDFNFFQYAFKMLGREYAKYRGWEALVQENKMLLTYMYAHKQGADYLQIFLGSEDASVRQAAANMVGMWADEKRGVGIKAQHLELPPELLTKLADMVGTGEVGWAATNSFGALAKRKPRLLVQTLTSGKEPVLHQIAELVDGSSTRSLAFVRTLVHFHIQSHTAAAEEDSKKERALPDNMEKKLVHKLKRLVHSSPVQRLRVQSAYLLYLLEKLDAAKICHEHITYIQPHMDTHWYEMEKKMLELLLRELPRSDHCERSPHNPLYPDSMIPDQEDIFSFSSPPPQCLR